MNKELLKTAATLCREAAEMLRQSEEKEKQAAFNARFNPGTTGAIGEVISKQANDTSEVDPWDRFCSN